MTTAETEPHSPPDPDREWLGARLEELSAIHRPSASPGERRAAEWIVARFAELGAEARIESERAHGTYWWPLGIGAAASALANAAALRGHRLTAAALGAAAGAALVDEFPPGKRRWIRERLVHGHTYNVISELGPADAERTVVVVAHHDAAHSGLIFHPEIPETIFRRWGVPIDLFDTSPALMWPLLASPALAVAAGLTGGRAVAKLGGLLGAGYVAAMAEIGAREVVPGANDNATAVILLLALARRLIDEPTGSTRVILLSTGSEESFSEGMKAFGERHFRDLPRESTFFLCVDTLGSPTLNILRGEGFVRMHEYPADALALIDGLAEELGIQTVPNLRLRNGTDGLESLAAGYKTVTLCSVTDLKQPANYHWPSDVAENVNLGTLSDAVRLSEALIRRLDERWL
ncbi:MAG TPA: M28 family peptidase [Solirubrobacterales bacterium]|nr:M28 family peptidase [Solirubrobacterales bacterium]